MPDVLIGAVPSYELRDDIDAFVARAFDAAGLPDTVFAEPSADRLVVVKPNWIQHRHQHDEHVWHTLITNPAVVVATMECAATLMGGIGTIAVCDAPHTDADFGAIVARGGLDDEFERFRQRWPDLRVDVIDLRREVWVTRDDVVVARRPNPHDPRGYVRCDLATDSLFFGHPGEGRFYGADYDTGELHRHHHGEVQEYLLAGTPMRADLFVNLPKLKTHKKTGITCCLKNLVGINGDKNWLPHHCVGPADAGGDEFPQASARTGAERRLKHLAHRAAVTVPGLGPWALRQMRRAGKQVLGDSDATIRNGNWYGNDTCWRMALDLNRALLYGNIDGSFRSAGERKPYLAIVDAIVAGQGNGPIAPDPADAGLLIAGTDPAAIDATCTRLMGHDLADFPIVEHAFADHRWPIAATPAGEVVVHDDRVGAAVGLDDVSPALASPFEPHFGWQRDGLAVEHGS